MPEFDYLIIGGGVSGIAAFEELADSGKTSIALLEARKDLMYTLSWMKSALFSGSNHNDIKGVEYREYLSSKIKGYFQEGKIQTGKRAFNIDQKKQQVFVRNSDGEQEIYSYKVLIVAIGATQILYGRHLLPGTRGARFFTAYQVGEMLEHYPFLPGKKLIVYGESSYAFETALSAYKRGIFSVVVSPIKIEIPKQWLGEIPVYSEVILKQVYGATAFAGMLFQKGVASISIEGDALAVDGDFVLEHSWREHLGVEWNLSDWKIDLSFEQMLQRKLIFVGDASEPSPNFISQYNSSKNIVKQLLTSKGAGA